jgi:uncharacterized membrane protein
MALYFLALLIGVVAGLRTLTAPAAVSWAAYLGWLNLHGTHLAFMGARVTPYIFTVLALVELVADQLPQTPSRTVPMQFGARLVAGGLSGAVLGEAAASPVAGLVAGLVGAVIGTLGGHAARMRAAAAFGQDLPAALLEDGIAIVAALLIVLAAS